MIPLWHYIKREREREQKNCHDAYIGHNIYIRFICVVLLQATVRQSEYFHFGANKIFSFKNSKYIRIMILRINLILVLK